MNVRLLRRTVATIVAATLVGCAPGESSGDASATTVVPVGVPVRSASIASLDVAGHGRAIAAQQHQTGTTTIVTTTGVRVTDAETGETTAVAEHETGERPSLVAFSPDGELLASVVDDPGLVRIQRADSGDVESAWAVPLGLGVRDLWFEPVNDHVVVETSAGPVLIGPDGAVVFDGTTQTSPTGRLGVLPDGTIVGTAADSADLAVIVDGRLERHPIDLRDGERVGDVSVAPDGDTIGVSVSSGEDQFERRDRVILLDTSFAVVGDLDTGQRLDALSWTMTDDLLVTAVDDQVVAWTVDGAEVGRAGTGGPIAALHALDDEVVIVGLDGSIDRWSGRDAPVEIAAGGVTTTYVGVDVETGSITTVDLFGRIQVRSLIDGQVLLEDDSFAAGELTSLAVSPDGSTVAATSTMGGVRVLDTDLGPRSDLAAAPYGVQVDAVAFDPRNGNLVTGLAERVGTGAFDDAVTGWTAELTERFRELGDIADVPGCSFFNGRLVFDPAGSLLYAASHDYGIAVIDAASGDQLDELPGSSTIVDLALSPDGTVLIATHEDGVVDVWDTADRTLISAYRPSQPGVGAIAVLPETDVMVVADLTGTLSLLEVTTGETLQVFDGTVARTRSLALTPDGAVLAAPMPDGSIGLWSTDSGDHIGVAAGHTGAVAALAFGRDGTRLYSASEDGTVRSWSVILEV